MTEVTMTSDVSVELVRRLAGDDFVANAARVSTLGEFAEESDRPIDGLIRALMRDRHGSPFEHNHFAFRVHAPLFVWTEHLRHRVGWNFNGESGRYKVMEPVFYTPPAERGLTQVGKAMEYDIRSGSDAQREFTASLTRLNAQGCYETYEQLLDRGIAREVARQVLPVNLMSTYYTACNARSLMAFLSLRTTSEQSRPLWEIEQIAKGYEAALAEAMPITHAAFNEFGRCAP